MAADRHGFHVHYALKANAEQPILTAIRTAGFGADCVSGGEVARAIQCGFDPAKIVFAGVGKRDDEIAAALDADIFCFNVESVQELEVIAGFGKPARLALRINPNIDAKTHKNITTGLSGNKFGIAENDIPAALDLIKASPTLDFIGFHVHIGSQITDMNVFVELCARVNEWNIWFAARGFAPRVLNVGGGLGVDYAHPDKMPDFAAYFDIFAKNLKVNAGQEVHFELGRALVAGCGVVVSRVLYTKGNFIILDAGMNDLMRPALYGAVHKIENLSSKLPPQKYNVVGPVCESTDIFASDTVLPETKRGDIIVIHTAGAYGQTMAGTYNLRPLIGAQFN